MELEISITGEIVKSNFNEFAEELTNTIKALNLNLKTDEDFEIAAVNVESLKLTESGIVKAKEYALSQAEDIQKLFDGLDSINEEAQKARISLEKSIKKNKEEVKNKIIETALTSIDYKPIDKKHRERVALATKSKRKIETIRAAANSEAAIINLELKSSRDVIARYIKDHDESIAYGKLELELRSAKELELEFSSRVERRIAEQEKADLKAKLELEKKKQVVQPSVVILKDNPPVSSIPPDSKPAPARGRGGVNFFDNRSTKDSEPLTDKEVNEILDEAKNEDVELLGFCKLVVNQFAQIKTARELLQFEENVARAQKFSESVNNAFKELKGKKS